jgi:hypothetical protein
VAEAVRLITSLQGVLQVVSLAAALYALYELITEPDWCLRPTRTLARVWIVALCGTIGAIGLLFGDNAALLIADRLGAPLNLVQLVLIVSLAAAALVWSRE